MKQSEFLVGLISIKEQVHLFYGKKARLINPLIRGVLSFITLFFMVRLFDYGSPANRLPIILALSVIQGLLPIAFLYYFASVLILCNLWQINFDIFFGFAAFLVILFFCYYRIETRYAYLAVIVPVLFYFKIGIFSPVVFAIAIGIEALVPVASGIFIYYLSKSIASLTVMFSGTTKLSMGRGIQTLAKELIKNKEFIMILGAACIAIVLTSLLRRLFYERAWIVSIILGNAFMAFLLLMGRMYFEIDSDLVNILIQMLISILCCLVVQFFLGIGDVSRVEKIIFEDEDYIYYVKAVPKVKVTKSDPNVKVMGEEEALLNPDIEEAEEEMTEEMTEEMAEEAFELPESDYYEENPEDIFEETDEVFEEEDKDTKIGEDK